MIRKLLLIAGVLVFLLLADVLSVLAQVQVGQKAPALVLRAVGDARYFNLANHVGSSTALPKKAMVVSFFATWCAPCKKELPILQRLLDKLACKQLDAVLVGSGAGQTEKHLLSFARKKRLRVRLVSDVYRTAAKAWGVNGLPATFLIDGRGRIRKRFLRYRPDFGREMSRAIRKLLGRSASGRCEIAPAPTMRLRQRLLPVAVVVVEGAKASKDDLDDIRLILRSRLSRSGKFILVSKSSQLAALRAQRKQAGACSRFSASCRLRLGKLLSAKYTLYARLRKRGKRYRLSLAWTDLETSSEKLETVWQQKEESADQLTRRAMLQFQEQIGLGEGDIGATPVRNTPSAPIAPSTEGGFGTLRIESIPAGASVLVDGVSRGKTPLTLRRVEAGQRTIEISHKGYATLEKAVSLRARGYVRIREQLARQRGTLVLQSTPGALLYINNRYRGAVPASGKIRLTLATGVYVVRLRKRKYTTLEKSIRVVERETTTSLLPMRGLPGRLRVRSVPSGAKVSVDSVHKGRTPITLSDVEAGSRSVKLEKRGFQTVVRQVEIPAGGYRSLAVQFKKGSSKEIAKGYAIQGLAGAKRVWIPPGSFTMGSPHSESGRYLSESPQHQVRISRGFWMMQTEVTQAQFQALMGYNPARFTACGAGCPVEQVNWHEAAAFANELSTKQGLSACFQCSGSGKGSKCSAVSHGSYVGCRGWRLPTEAEWEYAYRAGTTTAFYNGDITQPKGKDPTLNSIGWYDQNSGSTTHGVGSKQANGWGLYDMAGNVWEWVYDWKDTYSSAAVSDPVGPSSGSYRVIRGGGWYGSAGNARAARRSGDSPGNRDGYLGFRLVKGGL